MNASLWAVSNKVKKQYVHAYGHKYIYYLQIFIVVLHAVW